jgi:hypothetical protein
MKLINLALLSAHLRGTTTEQIMNGEQIFEQGTVNDFFLPTNKNDTRLLQVTTTSNNGMTYYFTTRYHKVRDLCWPGNTQEDAVTKYQGQLCADGFSIVWNSMKTVAGPDSDVVITAPGGERCEWSRWNYDAQWNAKFLGSTCGDSPDTMTLPRNTAETTVTMYWDYRLHQDPSLCWNGAPGSYAKARYVGTMCPDDRSKVIWNSILTVDANGNAITCPNGRKAVWSRYDSDPTQSIALNEYFGGCGVAPTLFPDLRTIAADPVPYVGTP